MLFSVSFFFSVTAADHRREANYRRIGADASEKAERRQVQDAFKAERGNEGNWPWNDGADHQLVDVTVVVLLRADDHDLMRGRTEGIEPLKRGEHKEQYLDTGYGASWSIERGSIARNLFAEFSSWWPWRLFSTAEARYFLSIQLFQYSFHSTDSPAGRI